MTRRPPARAPPCFSRLKSAGCALPLGRHRVLTPRHRLARAPPCFSCPKNARCAPPLVRHRVFRAQRAPATPKGCAMAGEHFDTPEFSRKLRLQQTVGLPYGLLFKTSHFEQLVWGGASSAQGVGRKARSGALLRATKVVFVLARPLARAPPCFHATRVPGAPFRLGPETP